VPEWRLVREKTMRRQRQTPTDSRIRRLAVAVTAVVFGVSCSQAGSSGGERPHVQHITLPTHQTWQVVSVQQYEGLEEVELVKVDWPNPQEPTFAFALSREGLKTGDAVCMDHIVEIDTFWAHPMPAGGCEALGKK
jgi:hypothetical protein